MDRFIENHTSSQPNLSSRGMDPEDDISGNWMEMKEDNSLHSSQEGMQTSRFRVAPVDVEVAHNNHPHHQHHIHRTERDGRNSTDNEEFSSPVGSFAQRMSVYSNSYDTKNLKSLRHYTREALPRADHYRNIMSVHGHMSRPTLDELHGGQHTIIIESSVSLFSRLKEVVLFFFFFPSFLSINFSLLS